MLGFFCDFYNIDQYKKSDQKIKKPIDLNVTSTCIVMIKGGGSSWNTPFKN